MKRATCLAIVCAQLVAGCSLLGLDNFAVPVCATNADCQALNTLNHIAATDCRQYQCVAQSCALATLDADQDGEPSAACGGADCDDQQARVRGGANAIAETCDGLDNDCSGVIDDGVLAAQGGGLAVTGISGLARVAYAHAASGQIAAAYQYTAGSANAAGSSVLTGATASPATLSGVPYETSNEGSLSNLTEDVFEAGCSSMGASCDVDDLSLDAAGASRWFIAAVNTSSGCAGGQLRIGALEQNSAAGGNAIVLRGPAARSDVYAGVDVNAMGCTGASRAGGTPGAARPAIGSSTPPTGFPQAVVAWLGDAVSRGECGGASAEVDALGVWLESDVATHTDWVNATGVASSAVGARAVPQMLGTTVGGGAPAVVAAGGSYVVGYANASGGLELRAVGAFGNPMMFDAVAARCEGSPGSTPPGCVTPRATPSLALGAAFTLRTGAPPDHVAIALGPAQGGAIELGLAWQQGCGTANAAIEFQRVLFTPADTGGAFTAVGSPVELTSAADHAASQPTLAYVPTGFVRSGYARGGVAATAANAGGWLVAWVDRAGPQQVMARRVAEFDGAPLDAAANVTVGASASGPLLAPAVYTSAASPAVLSLAYGDPGQHALVGSTLLCAPP